MATTGTGGNHPPELLNPQPQATSSPIQLLDWQSRLGQGNTNAQTRTVQDNELVANQLNNLTSSDSRYIQIARDNAMNAASNKGMMMSTMAAGNAERAAIEAGLPIAQADASTYGRTASENMAATNQDRLADQNMFGNLLGQEVGIRANLDESERNRGFLTNERLGQQQFQTGERVGTQTWQSGENLLGRQHQTDVRLGQQTWQTGEREAGQLFQTGERLGGQAFTATRDNLQQNHEYRLQEARNVFESAMRELDRDASMTQLDKQLVQQRFLDFNNSMRSFNEMLTQTLTSIYQNPNLTAAQQQAAAANAQAVHQSLFNSYASTMSGGVPQIFWNPYPMGGAPTSGGGTFTGGNLPPVTPYTPPPTTPTTTDPIKIANQTGGGVPQSTQTYQIPGGGTGTMTITDQGTYYSHNGNFVPHVR